MTEAGNNYSEKKIQLHISVRNLVEFRPIGQNVLIETAFSP